MPLYVDDPDSNEQGQKIDIIELQKRNPLEPLPPHHGIMDRLLNRDTWQRREAILILAGYDPDNTEWPDDGRQFAMTHSGKVAYLDGTMGHILRDHGLHHPMETECLAWVYELAGYSKNEPLDEKKTPDEWLEWAKSKEFVPYWTEHAEPSHGPMVANAESGITKNDVINAFADIYWSDKQWQKNLGSPREWLKRCRVTPGVKGKHASATWNPVLIAVELFDKQRITIQELDYVFSSKLKEWKEKWEEESAGFRPT